MRHKLPAFRAWLFLAALAALTVTLGVLQYRWLSEVSVAERDRLRDTLEAGLAEVSDAFNEHLTAEVRALLPEQVADDRATREKNYIDRFLTWRRESPHTGLFRSVSLAVPEDGAIRLYRLDPEQHRFIPVEWPAEWSPMRRRIETRAFSFGGPPPDSFEAMPAGLTELPIFGNTDGPPQPGVRGELEWLVLDIDQKAFASELLPTLMRRYTGDADYDVGVVLASDPAKLVYGTKIATKDADASVRLFEIRFDRLRHRHPGDRERREPRQPSRGSWMMLVRHRAGSLDALVEHARLRNVGMSFGILLLISGAAAALLKFTRRAQHLADLQMEFVAGVSHELRTPLSVMRTAGHNLRGRLSENPQKVQKYGELIESESEKLTNIVNQILAFSNARAGRAMTTAEVLSVPALLEQALSDEERVLAQSGCRVEKHIDTTTPLITGDPTTLRQAFRNLISNAAKYGSSGQWIRITAEEEPPNQVVIRVADRGEGIASEDLEHIFDPFYRGRGAIDDQIHGTGLGLSLTRRIIEAHRGTVAVASNPGEGAEFTVRLPSTGHYDDFANTVD